MDEVVLSMTISQLIGFSTDSSIFHEMKNGEHPKNLEFSPFFSVPDVIRTRGLPRRRRTLYPAELPGQVRFFVLRRRYRIIVPQFAASVNAGRGF